MKIKSRLLLILLSVVTLFSIVTGQQKIVELFNKDAKSLERTPDDEPDQGNKSNYDSVEVNKLNLVLLRFAKTSTYLIKGHLEINDYADSLGSMPVTNYILVKDGNSFYYEFGNVLSINTPEQYLFVDHDAQKILKSKSKQTVEIPFDLSALKQFAEDEEYDVNVARSGSIKTVTFKNEYHVSCKQYGISYDTITNRPTFIFTRLTNLSDLLATDTEKHVKNTIERINERSSLRSYFDLSAYIERGADGVYHGSGRYSNYQLIEL